MDNETVMAAKATAFAEFHFRKTSGKSSPKGKNSATLPRMIRAQKAVVDGCPGSGTKQLIERITGTRLMPGHPLDGEIGGGASVSVTIAIM